MIEIEVEMDVEVTYAEIDGIDKELEKLAEVEMLQEQMIYQAEAQDEVRRPMTIANLRIFFLEKIDCQIHLHISIMVFLRWSGC